MNVAFHECASLVGCQFSLQGMIIWSAERIETADGVMGILKRSALYGAVVLGLQIQVRAQ